MKPFFHTTFPVDSLLRERFSETLLSLRATWTVVILLDEYRIVHATTVFEKDVDAVYTVRVTKDDHRFDVSIDVPVRKTTNFSFDGAVDYLTQLFDDFVNDR